MKAETPAPFVVVLHLTTQENETYGHPWYELVKSIRPDCDYLDIDQRSEKSLLEQARKGVEQARPFIILADVQLYAETPPGMSMLADTILRNASHSYAVFKGQHKLIQTWLMPLRDHFFLYKNEEELRVLLKEILNQDLQN